MIAKTVKAGLEFHIRTVCCIVMVLGVISACSSTKVIKANSTPPIQASGSIPSERLLDVGVVTFDANIPPEAEIEEHEIIIPDVRRAEARYIPYHLKDTLELTGNWGAVRVTPEASEAVDLIVRGKIVLSDGEKLVVQVRAEDATGRVWLDKEYSDNASKFSYRRASEDPFQDLYNDIANDLLIYRQKLSRQELMRVHQVAQLKYAESLSPEAFGDYLEEGLTGRVKIKQLPAENDAMMERVNRIKQREYLFVDTLDDYYGKFYHDMKPSYDEWRFATYEEALKLRETKKQARNRLLGGAAMIAGGIYASQESGTWAGQAASTGAVVGGIGAIKSGLNRRKDAEIHEQSLKELSQSLGSEITPFVLDIEGRTVELTGTADAQYEQWREILKEIYAEETGLPVE